MFCYSWICPFSFCQKFSYFVLGLPCTPFRFFTTLASGTTLVSVTTLAGLTTLVTVILTLVHCCSSSLVSRHRSTSFPSKCTIESMLYCSHLPNMLLWFICQGSQSSLTHWSEAPVFQKVDSAIHRINLYPVDSEIGFLGLILIRAGLLTWVSFNPG